MKKTNSFKLLVIMSICCISGYMYASETNSLASNVLNPVLITNFADLQAAYTASQITPPGTTTYLQFTANITTNTVYSFVPDAEHPVSIDGNGKQFIIANNGTLGGSLSMSSNTTSGLIQIQGATTTNITGGTYSIIAQNAPIIYAVLGTGITNLTKVFLSNSTFSVPGFTVATGPTAASIVRYFTSGGNLISATNCIFNMSAQGIAFSCIGPQDVIIKDCTLNFAGSDPSAQAFNLAPTNAAFVASSLTIDGLALTMAAGNVFTTGAPGTRPVNIIIRDITYNGNSSAAFTVPTGGSGVKKLYDFRAYIPSASVSGNNVTLGLTGTGTGDAAGANIVYTIDGTDPVAGTGFLNPTIISKVPVIKMSANKDGFIGKSLTVITGTSSATDLINITNGNINVANSGLLTFNSATTTIKNITVAAGGKVTLDSGNKLNVTNITFQSDATNGTGTYVDNGTTNIITASVQQYLTSGRNWYISSPVSGACGNVVLGTPGNNLWQYNEVNSDWTTEPTNASTPLTVMKGFVANTVGGIIGFTGPLNSGNLSITLNRTENGNAERGYNLVGNPYPSYLDWTKVYTASSNIDPSIWYRTMKGSVYEFDTYNAVSGVGTNNGSVINQFIPPMQAFWVLVTEGNAAGTFVSGNAMRSHDTSGMNQLKTHAAITTNTQPILRLQVSNDTNIDETIVLFNPNATNGFDTFDSPKMTNANVAIPEIYTMAGTKQTVINGMNSISPAEELPLGFSTGQANIFTIKASEISNFDADTRIILKDNLLNIQQDLTKNATYSFASEITSTTNRFSLIFKSSSISTGLNVENQDENILIYRNANNQITIQCNTDSSSKSFVTVCNAIGQKIATKQIKSFITIMDNTFRSGVYLVSVVKAGKSSTEKVVLN